MYVKKIKMPDQVRHDKLLVVMNFSISDSFPTSFRPQLFLVLENSVLVEMSR